MRARIAILILGFWLAGCHSHQMAPRHDFNQSSAGGALLIRAIDLRGAVITFKSFDPVSRTDTGTLYRIQPQRRDGEYLLFRMEPGHYYMRALSYIKEGTYRRTLVEFSDGRQVGDDVPQVEIKAGHVVYIGDWTFNITPENLPEVRSITLNDATIEAARAELRATYPNVRARLLPVVPFRDGRIGQVKGRIS